VVGPVGIEPTTYRLWVASDESRASRRSSEQHVFSGDVYGVDLIPGGPARSSTCVSTWRPARNSMRQPAGTMGWTPPTRRPIDRSPSSARAVSTVGVRLGGGTRQSHSPGVDHRVRVL